MTTVAPPGSAPASLLVFEGYTTVQTKTIFKLHSRKRRH
jgi:hypothetical protein